MKKGNYRSFEEARKFVQSLKLESSNHWAKYAKSGKRPKDIPHDLSKIYKKEWTTWGDFLGTGFIGYSVRSANFLPWPEAKQKIRELGKEYGLKGFADWSKFAKTHGKLLVELNLPAAPWMTYTKAKVWSKMKK